MIITNQKSITAQRTSLSWGASVIPCNFCEKRKPPIYNGGQKSLGTRKKSAKLDIVKNALRKSVALFISHCFARCPPPLPPQAMLKAPAMILGVKGPSNQHCIGGGGGIRGFAVFL